MVRRMRAPTNYLKIAQETMAVLFAPVVDYQFVGVAGEPMYGGIVHA